uniref:Uncharacterized protein n=1 Tax=Octopus bimaculoides TaxID=37653 RepID=A0A0L8FJR7_OCTBM
MRLLLHIHMHNPPPSPHLPLLPPHSPQPTILPPSHPPTTFISQKQAEVGDSFFR